MAKVYASEVAMRGGEGVQIHGGTGTSRSTRRSGTSDAKITEIYEGTSEIQRLVIASALLKE